MSDKDPLPFQQEGIAFALERPASLIADAMGLGKTARAVGVINADPSVRRVLIVCPASVRIPWQRELEQMAGAPVRHRRGGCQRE